MAPVRAQRERKKKPGGVDVYLTSLLSLAQMAVAMGGLDCHCTSFFGNHGHVLLLNGAGLDPAGRDSG